VPFHSHTELPAAGRRLPGTNTSGGREYEGAWLVSNTRSARETFGAADVRCVADRVGADAPAGAGPLVDAEAAPAAGEPGPVGGAAAVP
jgi:hypothetical protein